MNKKVKLFAFAILAATFGISCQKLGSVLSPAGEAPKNVLAVELDEDGFHYESEYAYNLNVIYFTPTDNPACTDWERRISEILLQGQSFVKSEMARYGYDQRTFGLLKDDSASRVRMIHIEGQYDKAHYPYSGGSGAVMDEINAYFSQNPSKKTSDHILVIMPKNDDAGGAPFYGIGRWCFAIDYPEMDVQYLGAGGTLGSEATKWIGGLMHELGHGLNLPHNRQKVSEQADPNLGTSLMGSGNYTYGKSPTFLTKASCAILRNGQLFSKTGGTFYNGTTTSLEKIYATYQNGNIIVSGRYATNVPVVDIAYYNDPKDDNADYDAVAWANQPIGTDSFYVSMPISELHKKGDIPYELRIRLVHENGNITTFPFAYEFLNGEPVVDFGYKRNTYDKSNWQVLAFSSEETSGEGANNGLAINIIDNDVNSYWHSRWTGGAAELPHSVTVDMATGLRVAGFTFVQRTNSRHVKDITIMASSDSISWASLGDFVVKDVNGPQHIYLTTPASFRYFKLLVNSNHDGTKFSSLAEVSAFGDPITDYDRSNWQVLAFSSEEPTGEGVNNGRAIHVLDDDESTFWHSRWTGTAAELPHSLTIDMASVQQVSGFSLVQRTNVRHIKNITMEASSDMQTWVSLGSFVVDDVNGSQRIYMASPMTFRYFRLTVNSNHDGTKFSSLAEIRAFN